MAAETETGTQIETHTDWKFITMIIILGVILAIMGFLVYINIREIKNTDKKCLTMDDVKKFHPIQPIQPVQPVQSTSSVPSQQSTPAITYTCQNLLDQFEQIVPYVLWNKKYREMVISFLHQRDQAYDIAYLRTLDDHILFLLVQSVCTPGNMYKGECMGFSISELKNIPFDNWADTDRIDAIDDLYSIFALNKKCLHKLNNKTLHDLVKIACTNY